MLNTHDYGQITPHMRIVDVQQTYVNDNNRRVS